MEHVHKLCSSNVAIEVIDDILSRYYHPKHHLPVQLIASAGASLLDGTAPETK
jgi:hypothetical protein